MTVPAPGVHGRRPLSASEVAGAAVRIGEPQLASGRLWWVASALDAAGGMALFSADPANLADPPTRASPEGLSVRSALYQYGAGSWCPTPLGPAVIEGATHRLGVLGASGFVPSTEALEAPAALGDPVWLPDSTSVVVVRDDPGGRRLLVVDLETHATTTLLASADLLAEPVVSHDGTRLAWLAWRPGTMPWDAAELWTATLGTDHGRHVLVRPRRVDGGIGSSVGQPTWLDDGSLAYVGEAAGYWQPWLMDAGGAVRRLSSRHAEFQRPRWSTCRWLAQAGPEALACVFTHDGRECVGLLGLDGTLLEVEQPCVRVDGLASDASTVAWVGATAVSQGAVLSMSVPTKTTRTFSPSPRPRVVVAPPAPRVPLAPAETFICQHQGVELHGLVWQPRREVAPLVLAIHPGPTGAVDASCSPLTALLVSNGFAVASLDFSGSTGHGRTHRDRLVGRFCELDVEECTAAAAALVDRGVADPTALFVRGTSAGGTAALLALCSGKFRGAVAWYPASSFARDEGGFEQGYLDRLLGELDDPDERAPGAHAASMRGSVLLIQGDDDPIVPAAHTAELAATLRRSLLDVTLLEIPGEGHGFRTTSGRTMALDAELAFYRRLSVPIDDQGARYDASTVS